MRFGNIKPTDVNPIEQKLSPQCTISLVTDSTKKKYKFHCITSPPTVNPFK